jgi:hypothetical protein
MACNTPSQPSQDSTSCSPPTSLPSQPPSTERKILLRNIANIDEIPVPFETFLEYILAQRGAKSISIRTRRNQSHRRATTLLLCLFADGIDRVKPLLVYHSSADDLKNKLRGSEGHLYHLGVIVKYNETAWINEALIIE